MSEFVITQITDLHLTANDADARTEPKVFGALTGMNTRFRSLLKTHPIQQCDLLLVTGDITDLGDITSWQTFWQAISDNRLDRKTRIILGNHDIAFLKLIRNKIPRATRSQDRMRYRLGLRLGKAPEAFPWQETYFGGDLLLVALRSTQEGNVTQLTNAVGRLSVSQLDGLRKALRNSKARYKIVTLHHPPCFPADGSVNSFLHDIQKDEAEKFLSICEKYGASLVIHGHMHCYMDQTRRNVRIVGAAASTQPVGDDPGTVEICQYRLSSGIIAVSRLKVKV